jgi:thioredoxin 1
MANVEELTDKTFSTSLRADGLPVLVDFSATWCGPCKALAPTIDAVANLRSVRQRVDKVLG